MIFKNHRIKKLKYVLDQSIKSYQGLYGEINVVALATDCGLDIRELYDCLEGKSDTVNYYQRIIRTLNKATIYYSEIDY